MKKNVMKQMIDNYINDLKHAVRHPLMEKNIGEVKLNESLVFFLLLPLLNGEKWDQSTHTAAIAVGAVHIAFDAHDAINEYDATSTGQQLTVLSGDYYSGIHYKLLASLPDYKFIRTLSQTIGKINETKADFHKSTPNGPEQLMSAARTIEAGCITDFLHTFSFPQYAPLAAVALPLISLDTDLRHSNSDAVYAVTHWNAKEADIRHAINAFRKELQAVLDEADFLNPVLAKEIRQMTTPLLGELI